MPSAGRILKGLLFILAASWLGICAYLWWLQARLIIPPFGPESVNTEGLRRAAFRVEEVTIAGSPALRGWFIPARAAAGPKAPLLILFLGNMEEPSWLLPEIAPVLPEVALLAVNYRGQGLNRGEPGEDALFADALRIYDQGRARPDVDGEAIHALGRSLGSGVAVYLATQRKVKSLLLVTPYDSIRAVSRRMYPFVPIGWLLRHPFDSLSRASGMRTPALFMIAGRDTVIPPEHARRLYDAWAGARQWRLYAGAGHNEIFDAPDLYTHAREFLGLPPRLPPG